MSFVIFLIFPQLKNCHFILLTLGFLVLWNVGRPEIIIFIIMHTKNIKVNKGYVEKIRETTGTEIQSQHWGGNTKLSMEGIAVEYFTNSIDHGSNEKNLSFMHI